MLDWLWEQLLAEGRVIKEAPHDICIFGDDSNSVADVILAYKTLDAYKEFRD